MLPLHRWKANYHLLMVIRRHPGLENIILPFSVVQSSRGSPPSTDTLTTLITTEHNRSFYLRAPQEHGEQKHMGFCVLSQYLKSQIADNSFWFYFTAPPVHSCISYFFWSYWMCRCASCAPKSLEISSQYLEIQKEMLNWSGWLPESRMAKPQI